MNYRRLSLALTGIVICTTASAESCESKFLRIPCGNDPGIPSCQVKYQKLAACKEQERSEAEIKKREREQAELDKKRDEVEAVQAIDRANANLNPHLRRDSAKQMRPSIQSRPTPSNEKRTGAAGF